MLPAAGRVCRLAVTSARTGPADVCLVRLYERGAAVLAARKADHLKICLEREVRPPEAETGLDRYHFVHQALPEIDLADVDLRCTLLGKTLRAPLLVASMTGGTLAARAINRRLAQASAELGLGMGVGSQRTAIEEPEWADTYRVRDVAPDILLLANLGAVQLNHTRIFPHISN